MNLDPQKSAQNCGCDEAANWTCERHAAEEEDVCTCISCLWKLIDVESSDAAKT